MALKPRDFISGVAISRKPIGVHSNTPREIGRFARAREQRDVAGGNRDPQFTPVAVGERLPRLGRGEEARGIIALDPADLGASLSPRGT